MGRTFVSKVDLFKRDNWIRKKDISPILQKIVTSQKEQECWGKKYTYFLEFSSGTAARLDFSFVVDTE